MSENKGAKHGQAFFFHDIAMLISFFRQMEINMRYFIASAVILGVLVFLYVYSIQLLYNLIDGIIKNNFDFVKGMRGPGRIVKIFPELFDSKTALFALLAGWTYSITVFRNLLQYFGQIAVTFQAHQASVKIRRLIFDRYLKFGKLFFDRCDIVNLNHVLISSTNTITSQVNTVHQLLTQLITLLVYVVMMFQISFKLTLAVLLIFPLMNMVSGIFILKLRDESVKYQKRLLNLNTKIFNILSCLPLVRGYCKEEAERKFFETESHKEVQAALAFSKLEKLIGPIQDLSQVTALLLAAWALAFLAAGDKAMDVSKIFVFFYLANRSVPVFSVFNTFKMSLAGLEGPIRQIEEILDDKGKFIIPEGNCQFQGLKNSIEFRSLNFEYVKKVPVLRNINTTLEKGKMTAIVGFTGAGKTTLMNLLLRFYDCPAGALLLDGKDIRDFTNKSLRDRMAFVTQEPFILNDTIRENVVYASSRDVSVQELIEILKKAKLYDYVMSLPEKWNTRVGDRGVQLSGGEKQRISLARAFLRDAEILILDEATSSLDSLTESAIQRALHETGQGRTTIVIAHRLSTIQQADKVIVLEKGRIVEQGTIQELMNRKGRLFEFWNTQKLALDDSPPKPVKEFTHFLDFEPSYEEACFEAAREKAIFNSFRSELPFLRLYENIDTQKARDFLEKALVLAPELEGHLDVFRTNDTIGGPVVYTLKGYGNFSGATARYIFCLAEMIQLFGSLENKNIVEIGGGYGGQAKIITDYFAVKSYTIIDLPCAAALTRKYLSGFSTRPIQIVESDKIEILAGQSWDLVISNYAFALFDRETQIGYLEKILKKSERGFLKCPFLTELDNGPRISRPELVRRLPQGEWMPHFPPNPTAALWVWGKSSEKNLDAIAVGDAKPSFI